jgi:hypothetical protein
MRVFWCCQQLGIETNDVDELKVFSKNLELVTQFFYAFQDRFLLEHPGDFNQSRLGLWLGKLKSTHPNHQLWLSLLFEHLPGLFALRTLIREGKEEDYEVRTLVWIHLSPYFSITNKTSTLRSF